MGGCTNVSACARIATPGGMVLGAEVGGGTVACAYAGTIGPESVIPGVDLMVGGVCICCGGGIRFHTLPQLLFSAIWVIVNTIALALDNANTLCCEPAVLSRMWAFR